MASSNVTINANSFYREYHGHKVNHLEQVHALLTKLNDKKSFIYLAGDSSLDNKFWLQEENDVPAVNGYEKILLPPFMKPDISYHLNKYLHEQEQNTKDNSLIKQSDNYYCINAAIEESTISSRKDFNKLLPQDLFIQHHIANNDILIVSLGGNDIALRPNFSTIWNMFTMNNFNSLEMIQKGPHTAWGMNHFIHMFKNDIQNYILQILSDGENDSCNNNNSKEDKSKNVITAHNYKYPKKVIICMIYYPDEKMTGSWADRTLGFLGYNDNPAKLQAAIHQIFLHATSQIKIELPSSPSSVSASPQSTMQSIPVIPFAMYSVLDGKCTSDYVQRVEPSSQGGDKLVKALLPLILSD